MQWEEVQINIELTINVSEKIEKATSENLESSAGQTSQNTMLLLDRVAKAAVQHQPGSILHCTTHMVNY